MNKYDAQGLAFDMQMRGISTGSRPLEFAARELYQRIYDRNCGSSYDRFESNELDLVDEDAVYACIVFAAALAVQPQLLPDTAKYFREVQHVLRNDADELRNVRTVLC